MTDLRNPEQHNVPLYETGDWQIDRFQRIDTIGQVAGFLSVTLAEQTEVMGLLSVIDRPGGAARHLAEVVKHQYKADTDDPQAAIRKIARNYIDYALDAKTRSQELGQLEAELTDANPTLILDRVISNEQPGLLAFLRYFDLALLKQTGKIEAVGYDPQKTDYSPSNSGIMYYAGIAMETWKVQQVRRRLPEAEHDQGLRLAFFAERLVEVEKHYPVLSPIAREGLDKIYDRPRAS